MGEQLLQTEKNGARTTVLAPLCLQSESMNTGCSYFFFRLKVENVKLALSGLLGNKMRSLLTMLGIIIGIGVMNIMLVSITERTREIGTRKALGAKNSSIRLQFIIEAVILCLLGGVFGIILGFILGAVAASLLGYAASAPVAAIIGSVVFSMIIGVFFGYYPANKAARLDPIEALRYE